jgi:translation initiation factor 1
MAKRRDLTPTESLSSNPFAALASIRDELPPGEAPPSETARPSEKAQRGPARAVIRYQRKGRGGKEATIVEQLGLGPELLDEWCRELKRALGCGGGVEDDRLVFGGDQRARLPAMLEAKGVRRITLG